MMKVKEGIKVAPEVLALLSNTEYGILDKEYPSKVGRIGYKTKLIIVHITKVNHFTSSLEIFPAILSISWVKFIIINRLEDPKQRSKLVTVLQEKTLNSVFVSPVSFTGIIFKNISHFVSFSANMSTLV